MRTAVDHFGACYRRSHRFLGSEASGQAFAKHGGEWLGDFHQRQSEPAAELVRDLASAVRGKGEILAG